MRKFAKALRPKFMQIDGDKKRKKASRVTSVHNLEFYSFYIVAKVLKGP